MLKSTTSIDTLFVGCSGIEVVLIKAIIDILPNFKHMHKQKIIQDGCHFNEKKLKIRILRTWLCNASLKGFLGMINDGVILNI